MIKRVLYLAIAGVALASLVVLDSQKLPTSAYPGFLLGMCFVAALVLAFEKSYQLPWQTDWGHIFMEDGTYLLLLTLESGGEEYEQYFITRIKNGQVGRLPITTTKVVKYLKL